MDSSGGSWRGRGLGGGRRTEEGEREEWQRQVKCVCTGVDLDGTGVCGPRTASLVFDKRA